MITREQLQALQDAVIATDLCEPQRRRLLLAGLDQRRINALPVKDRPDLQIISDLNQLHADVAALAGWLREAIRLHVGPPVPLFAALLADLERPPAATADAPRPPPAAVLRWRSAHLARPADDEPTWLGTLTLPPGRHRFGRRHTAEAAPGFHPLLGATHRMARVHFFVDVTADALILGREDAAGTLRVDGRRLPRGQTARGPCLLEGGGLEIELGWEG